MRQSSNGMFTTILMLIPVVVIPVIAMFGLPSLPKNGSLQDAGELSATHHSNALLGSPANTQPGSMPATGAGAPANFGHQPTTAADLLTGHSQASMNNLNNAATSQGQLNQSGFGETPQAVTPVQTQLQAESTPNQFPLNQQTPASQNPVAQQSLAGNQQPSPFGPLGEETTASSSPAPSALTDSALTDRALTENPVTDSALTENAFGEIVSAGTRQSPTGANSIQQVGTQQEQTGPVEEAVPNRFNQDTSLGTNPAASPPAALSQQMIWASAVQKLNAYGITNFLLQPGAKPGTFHFSCFYIPNKNFRISHRFEAEHADPLKAFENVLQQIQQRRQASTQPVQTNQPPQ